MRIPGKTLSTATCLVIPLLVSCASYEPANLLINHDFEELGANQKPVAWITSQHAGKKAYQYELDTDVFFKGMQSFRVEQYTDQAYGLVRQTSALPDQLSKNFTFSAMMRTEDVDAGKGWRLVLNCRAENNRILKQYQSQPLSGTTDWQRVTLEGEIPEGTVKFDAGIMLQSLGTGWVDDAFLSVN